MIIKQSLVQSFANQFDYIFRSFQSDLLSLGANHIVKVTIFDPGEGRLLQSPCSALNSASPFEKVWVSFSKPYKLILPLIEAKIAIRSSATSKKESLLPFRKFVNHLPVFAESFTDLIIKRWPKERWRQQVFSIENEPDSTEINSRFDQRINRNGSFRRSNTDSVFICSKSVVNIGLPFTVKFRHRANLTFSCTKASMIRWKNVPLLYQLLKTLANPLNLPSGLFFDLVQPLICFWEFTADVAKQKLIFEIGLSSGLNECSTERIFAANRDDVTIGQILIGQCKHSLDNCLRESFLDLSQFLTPLIGTRFHLYGTVGIDILTPRNPFTVCPKAPSSLTFENDH